MLQQVENEVQTDLAAEKETASRRSSFESITKLALGVVAGAALWFNRPAKAHNFGSHPACCHLAKNPSGGYCAYNCWRYASLGYQARGWYCREGGTDYYCFECTKGSTCWNGPWLCSDYWAA